MKMGWHISGHEYSVSRWICCWATNVSHEFEFVQMGNDGNLEFYHS